MTRKQWSKLLIAALVLAAVVLLCIRYLVPLSRLLSTDAGRLALYETIHSYGALAPVIYIIMMALQIVIAFIPGGPMELLGGMLFGSLWGILYSAVGVVAGTALVLVLVKRFGRPLVSYFVSDQQMERFSILNHERKLEILVFLLFLLPGIPKDLLTYVVPLTRMNPLHFLFLATIARMPALAASVMVGDQLTKGNYTTAVVICVIAVIVAFAGFLIRERVLKKKGESV